LDIRNSPISLFLTTITSIAIRRILILTQIPQLSNAEFGLIAEFKFKGVYCINFKKMKAKNNPLKI